MGEAKKIIVKPINSKDANRLCKLWHYSGKVVPNSQLHFGVWYQGHCEGVMQYGPSMNKKGTINLVNGTSWNGFIELNRMAFSEKLPKYSESRAISVAHKLIKKSYPHIEWVISFADGCQCGDGAIYRASGFILTNIRKNVGMWRLKSGEVICDLILTSHKSAKIKYGMKLTESKTSFLKRINAERLKGFQLRYIYFLNQEAKERLTVPIIPFDKIKEMGASMYLGKRIEHESNAD